MDVHTPRRISGTMLLFCLLCRLSISLAAKEYGIVYPTLLSARGSDEAKVLKINDHLTLNLKRSEVFSDNFMFISEENGERIHVPLRKEDYEKDLYHDEESMASLIVRTEDGVTAEGVINPTLRIKPLLEMGRSESGEIPHKLFEMPPETSEPPKHRDYKVANITAREDGFTDFLEERSTHSTLYPELHIVQDYAHARQFGFRKTDVIIYFGVFINAVNVMYKKNHSPKIQLRIAAITMSTQEEQYFYYADQNREQILDEQTLARFNEHYKTNVEFQTTDLTFLVTGLDMVFYENGVLQTWVGGYTYIGGFCQESKVGMSEDPPGSYYGVIVFAHEVGHSLGCVHDGDGAVAEVPGHKGSANCHWDQGYLMSYVRKNSNQFRFSPCCLADIKNVLSHQEWGCLRNRSRKSIKHPGYPGQYISGEEYCQRCYPHIRGVHYDKKRGVVDCKVRCGSSAGDSVLIGVPDGAPCDAERRGRKRCFLAKCRTMHSD